MMSIPIAYGYLALYSGIFWYPMLEHRQSVLGLVAHSRGKSKAIEWL